GRRSHSAEAFLGELEACSDFLQSTVAIKRTGVPLVVPITVGVLASVAALIVILVANPFGAKERPSPAPAPGPTTEEDAAKRKAEYERLKKLGDAQYEKKAYAEAKGFYLQAQEQDATSEIASLIKVCTYHVAQADYTKAREDRDYETALDHIRLVMRNAPSVREERKAEEIETELKGIIALSDRLYQEARTLDAEKKFLRAMPKYGEYIGSYPHGEHIEVAQARYAELEKLTESFQGLLVKSAPPGAEVYLDDDPIGRTPAMHADIAEGDHTLRIEIEGHKPLVKTIRYEGKRLTLSETLEKEVFGSVSVRCADDRQVVIVHIDGIRYGKTPASIDRILPGKHTMKYVGPDEVTYEEEILVEGEKTLKVVVDFQGLVDKEKAAFDGLPRGKNLTQTRAIYEGFTQLYPKGRFTPKARKIVKDLDALEADYRDVEGESVDRLKLTAAETFLSRHGRETYPLGWHVAEVEKTRARLRTVLEKEAFDAIFSERTFAGRRRAAKDYLDEFPRSSRTAEVEEYRRSLVREETLYMEFQREYTFAAKRQRGDAYVREFPQGLKFDEVKKALKALRKQETDAFEAFRATEDVDEIIAAGDAFLSDFKGSEYEKTVAEETSAAKAEKRAFEKTKESPQACEDYLKRYPKGRFRDAVRSRFDRFGWARGEGVARFQGKLPGNILRGKNKGEYLNKWDDAVMVYVPGGFFPMGTNDFFGEDEDGPEVTVFVSAFFIDKYEVTNRQYGKFLEWWEDATDKRKFSHPEEPAGHDHTPAFLDDPKFNQPDQPVVGVDWLSAWAYARWAGKTLPTEAQWEKAASADIVSKKKSKFPWGDRPPTESLCAFDGSREAPASVSDHAKGRSPFGVYNMAGNAAEWCLDGWADDFLEKLLEHHPKDGRQWAVNPVSDGPADGPHAVRGGHWKDDEEALVVTRRRKGLEKSEKIGFRCASWHVQGK
ncbi:MAG: SUMF1/EgtB/PvdO family nonheme iron enzyme, partial [Planctomycetota bacterium]